MAKNPQPPKRWPHGFDHAYVYRRLNIPDSPNEQAAVRALVQEAFNVTANEAAQEHRTLIHLFRSSVSREILQREVRLRLDRVPLLVRNHIRKDDVLVTALYRLMQALSEELLIEFEEQAEGRNTNPNPTQPLVSTQKDGNGKAPISQQPVRFDFGRPYVVPNGDIQIIRADYANMPIPIRMSDLLKEKDNPQDVSPDGDWINIANIQFDYLRQNLTEEGFLQEGHTVWLNHRSLTELNPVLLVRPQQGEARLTNFNFVSTIARTVREHWPELRNPSPDPTGLRGLSPLVRPNMTMIIRRPNVVGGALSDSQPALSRPSSSRGSGTALHNRRTEQRVQLRGNRREATKRKRTEKAATDTEGEGATGDNDSGAKAQPRRKRAKATPAAPAPAPATTATTGASLVALPNSQNAPTPNSFLAPSPGSGFAFTPVPAFEPSPTANAGQEPQVDLGDDQWAGLLDPAYYDQAGQEPQAGNGDDQWAGLLDPAYYDQAGMLGTDDDLQEFLKGNEEFLKFGQDAMEE